MSSSADWELREWCESLRRFERKLMYLGGGRSASPTLWFGNIKAYGYKFFSRKVGIGLSPECVQIEHKFAHKFIAKDHKSKCILGLFFAQMFNHNLLRCQTKRLNFAEFVWGQGGNDVSKFSESLIQRLCSLALTNVCKESLGYCILMVCLNFRRSWLRVARIHAIVREIHWK